jgi:D-alanyl-lipoteichoic acid acyltransferase DltB (MBOAT superfamily)
MLFNSFDFVVFLVVVTALYFVLPHKFRWMLLLGASCFFYMSFIPAYILILFFTIVVDYFTGKWIEDTPEPSKKRRYLLISILSVCANLFIFKYFNFFNQNVAAIAAWLNWNYPITTLQIILPIGLSFHTFQSLSYVIEVYRGRQQAERHFGLFALYVMYFPQLVAGPIERPQNLLHQFREKKSFDPSRLRVGLSLALWGLFKKVVVADSLALYVNAVYGSIPLQTGPTLLLATYFFAFQIYCDFSGYSDIARGVSRIYGIELMKNFETPYFADSIAGFWSRWHISLSTWFRDYVYIPLGGNRVSLARTCFNLLVVFMVSGFWHGAKWTFVIWGILHGIYVIIERLMNLLARRLAPADGRRQSGPLFRAFKVLVTFHLVLVAWVFFRADSVPLAASVLRKIAFDHGPLFWDELIVPAALAVVMLVALDAFNRKTDYWTDLDRFSVRFRAGYSAMLLVAVVLFGIEEGAQFIYFQF